MFGASPRRPAPRRSAVGPAHTNITQARAPWAISRYPRRRLLQAEPPPGAAPDTAAIGLPGCELCRLVAVAVGGVLWILM
jgi:hypothetical protein